MKTTLFTFIFLASSAFAATSLEEISRDYDLPALTIAKIDADGISQKTIGLRKKGGLLKATNSDRWHIGSNGKSITATLAAILVEKNHLTWDTTLEEVFPDWEIHQQFKKISLKELFSHRAGITTDVTKYKDGHFWNLATRPDADQISLRHQLAKAIVTSAPSNDGSKMRYSNSSYVVAAEMLSKRSGMEWEELIQKYIFHPLKMTSCGFGAPGKESPEVATEPWPHQQGIFQNVLTPVSPSNMGSDNPAFIGPAGIIHCSMADWLQFLKRHMDGFNGEDTEILSAHGFKMLHADYEGQGYTSGGLIYQNNQGRITMGHNGSNTMNFAIMVMDMTNRKAYVAAANRGRRQGEKGVQAAMQWQNSPDVCIGTFCLLTK